MKYMINASEIFLENEIIYNGSVSIENGMIKEIGMNIEQEDGWERIDLTGLRLLPGFVDIHVHGGDGFDTMDLQYESINNLSKYKLKEGVTSFCPTTVTSSLEKTKQAVQCVKEAMVKGCEGADIIGSFLEGPYIHPHYKGAHPEELIREVDLKEIESLYDEGENSIVSFALAPEKDQAIEAIRFLTEKGVKIRIGHSGATFNQVYEAVNNGASIAIHTYNAMSPLNHREPGMVGAILLNDSLYAEIICDLIHVCPEAVQILLKTKPKDKVVLITDCMMAGGLEDGKYKLGELDVIVKDQIARTDTGALAGSTLTILKAVENMHKIIGVSLQDAVNMASINPATAVGADQFKGSIKRNKHADLIAVDDQFRLKFVMTKGIIQAF